MGEWDGEMESEWGGKEEEDETGRAKERRRLRGGWEVVASPAH